jgi:hypothetical protein
MPTGRHLGHRAPNNADTAHAMAKAADLAPIIAELQAAGITSLRGHRRGAKPGRHSDTSRTRSVATCASVSGLETAAGEGAPPSVPSKQMTSAEFSAAPRRRLRRGSWTCLASVVALRGLRRPLARREAGEFLAPGLSMRTRALVAGIRAAQPHGTRLRKLWLRGAGIWSCSFYITAKCVAVRVADRGNMVGYAAERLSRGDILSRACTSGP